MAEIVTYYHLPLCSIQQRKRKQADIFVFEELSERLAGMLKLKCVESYLNFLRHEAFFYGKNF